MLVHLSFLPAHITRRNKSDQRPAKCEHHVKTSSRIGLTQGKVAFLALGMLLILGRDERQIEKRLFAFRWGNVVFFPNLAGVVFIPLKARTVGYFFHGYMYIMVIYVMSSDVQSI